MAAPHMIGTLRNLYFKATSPEVHYIRKLRRTGSVCFIHINKCGGTSVEKALNIPKIHDTALERIDKIGRARWDELFTFTIVRNPYERIASQYRYRVKTNQTNLGNRPLSLNEWIVETLGKRNGEFYDHPLMFAPCVDWITDSGGHILVDQILQLETLAADWEELKRRSGVTLDLHHENRTLTTRETSIEELNDTALDIVSNHFAADFEAFGYPLRSA